MLLSFLAAGKQRWFSLIFLLGVGGFLWTQTSPSYAQSDLPRLVANPDADCGVPVFTDDPDPVGQTGAITYEVHVKNYSSLSGDDVSSSTLQVVFDDRFGYSGYNAPSGVTCSQGDSDPSDGVMEVTCDTGTLAPLEEKVIEIYLTAPTSDTGTFTSTATVTCTPDGNSANNSENNQTTVHKGADIQMTKSVSPSSVPGGGIVTYQIQLHNAGPSAAPDLEFHDTLPNGVTFYADDAAPAADDDNLWDCTASGQDVTCTYDESAGGDFAAGSDMTFYFRAQATSSSTGSFVNDASVDIISPISDPVLDPNPDNNGDTATLTITSGTDLAISKSVSPSPVVGGQAATFTLHVQNLGPQDATDVTVTDTLPSGYTINNVTPPTGWTCSTQAGAPQVECTTASFANGATADITIDVTAPDVSAVETHTNTATVGTDSPPDPNSGNDTASVTYDVYPNAPDLTISKSKSPNPVAVGSPITSTIVVTNQGAVEADPVTVTDALSPNEAVDTVNYPLPSGSPWDCSYDSGTHTITCNYTDAPLAAGASAPDLVITTVAQAAGAVTNTGTASTPDDFDNSNDDDDATVTSTNEKADIVVSKSVDDTNLEVNETTLTYSITITNNGPDDATNIAFDDHVPMYVSGTTITVTDDGGANCSVTGGTVHCDSLTLANGASTTIIFTVERPMADGTFINHVCAYSADVGDPDRSNNCADADAVTVAPIADVAVTQKAVNYAGYPDPILAGTNATYTIQVRNNGPSTAANVQVADVFTSSSEPNPPQFTYVSSSVAGGGTCTYDSGNLTLNCDLGDMSVGQVKTITVVIRPTDIEPQPSPWHIDNTATVSTDTYDDDHANDSQSLSMDVQGGQVDVTIEKNESENFQEPVGYDPGGSGNLIVYKLEAYNYGPSYATHVTVTDRVDTVTPVQSPNQQLRFVGDTANSDGTGATTDWCSVPSPNPFSVNGTNDDAEPLITCNFPDMAPGDTVVRYLAFEVLNSPDPIQGDVYHDEAHISVQETETDLTNNDEDENTTVRVYADLEVTKSGPASPVEIYTPFNMTITVTNHGPGHAPNAVLTDNLPAGMVLTGAPTATSDWGDTVTCTGSAGDTSFQCLLGTVGYDTSHSPNAETITITVPVQVTDPNTTSYTNGASVTSDAPEKAPDPHPNEGGATVTMNPPVHLGDLVWYDQNKDGIQDANEPGISGVEVTLYASADCSGSPYSNPTLTNPVTTDSNGNYDFYPLPHGTYCVQFDFTTNNVLPGHILSPQNAGSDDAADSDASGAGGVYTIQNIDLTDTSVTEDLTNDMGVYVEGSIGDRVWCESPTNVNATFDTGDGDTGLNNITVSLYEDFDCDGNPDGAAIASTSTATGGTPNEAGFYQFTGLQVALAGDPNNNTCYVVQVDTSDPDLGDCSLPDTPPDGQQNPQLDTDNPDDDTSDFSFRTGDFGDLPDSGSGTFPTTLADNGPFHLLDANAYLGACVDAENDGVPADPDAGMVSGGDDGASGTQTVGTCAVAGDDEDGIEFVTPFIPGQQACINVTAHNATGTYVYLYGWADWNGDGQFSTAERLRGANFGSGRVYIPNGGVSGQQYCFDVPSGATFAGGDIHFRFRLTSDTLTASGFTGRATNGEVEDYWEPLACVGNFIWDDQGAASNDTQGSGDVGLANVPVRLVWAGADGTVDTSPADSSPASGELFWNTTTDANGRYQFCGIAPPSISGQSYTFQVQVPPYLGFKSVAKDVGGDDQLDSDADPEDALGTGWAAPAFTVAPDFNTASSAYMTLNGGAFPTGEAGLEDSNSQTAAGYPDNRTDWTQDFGFLVDKDYGDLPESGNGSFPTTVANNGAWHWVTPNLYLGSCVDTESDGQPSAMAGVGGSGGDDGNVGFDTVGSCAVAGNDEDGLLSNITPAAPGGQACFQVAAHNQTGQDARLYVWIDWNGDGQFQNGEQLTGYDFGTQGYAVIPNGTEPTTPLTECFTMPAASALAFDGGEVHTRLRLTTEDLSARPGGDPLWAGGASDGEVEDYWAPLACVGNLLWQDNGTTPNAQDGSDTPLAGVDVRLIWAGPDGTVDTAPGDATAQNDDLILQTTTTDGNGAYQFCGLPPGAGTAYQYQVQVPPVFGLYSVTKGAAAADTDSNATPEHSLANGWVADAFGLQVDYTASPGYILENGNPMPTGEAGNQDATSEANDHNFPDERTDWTQDFGFVQYDDYGDLPASYEAGNPAVHPLRPDLYLGGCVDAETANQPTTGADGDDTSAGAYTVGTCSTPGDDEDGVTLTTPLVPGAEACVEVTAANATGGNAYLTAWFDWNGDGTFDSGEQVNTGDFSGGQITIPDGGVSGQQYCFTVPSSATFDGGTAYYRFRLTTDSSLASPTGGAVDGEVEDYATPLACVGNLVWNDSTGSVQDQQDSGDSGVANVPVRLVWGGPNGTVETTPTDATAQGDDRLYTVNTDTNGVYNFCGLTGGGNAYQVQLASAPSGLPQAVTPDVGDDNHDSDGSASGSGFAAPAFTLSDVTALPTGEDGNQDVASVNGFPDNQVDETIDFGFRPTMVDYGDLLDSYGTTASANGPTHTITPDLYLGSCVDAELDGQTSTDATGDDANAGYYTAGTCTTAGDDEDGVRLTTPLVPGAQACVEVTAHNATGSDASLYAWFDWNGDGDFADAGEQVNTGDFSSGAVTVPNGGVSGQTYCFTVPSDATFQGGQAAMRFRLTTDTLTAPTGSATDGEVEDYITPLYCAGNFVWNDGGSATPDIQDGTEPGISGVTLTLHWDGDDNGSFGNAADRTYTTTTDANGTYAFCGLLSDATGDGNADAYRIDVTPPTGLTPVQPNQGSDEALDSDGDASGVGPAFTLPPSPDDDTATNDTDPNGYPDAQTHLSIDFGFAAYDFGDLPTPYATTLADNGPRHTILPSGNPTLGSSVDAETDGQPDATATGDDNTGSDDEDGVTLPTTFVAGQSYTITYTVSNAGANTVVSAWIDWNGDGDFADAGEQVLTNQSITADGTYNLNVTAPLSVASQVGVRFRIGNEAIDNPTGSINSGEVEDYLVGGQLTYDYGDLPDGFKTLDATGGPKHQLNAGLYLGSCVDGETDAAPDADAGVLDGGDDGAAGTVTVGTCTTPNDDEDGVTLVTPLLPGAQACVQVSAHNTTGGDAYLYAWFDWNGDDQFQASEQVSTGDFNGGGVTIPDNGTGGTYCFDVPADATFEGGEVHMRFRLTTDDLTAADWGGTATDGEVEDYWEPLACVGNYIWNDTGSTTVNEQDASDQPLEGVGVNLTWAGQDGNFGTTDDVTVNTTTDAQGRYAFCGLTPDSQVQLSIPTLPAGLNQPVVPDQGSDVSDSDGTQPGGLGTAVILPPVTVPALSDLAAGNWVTGENANEDNSTQTDPTLTHGYPDGRTNLTFDFGLRQVTSAAVKSVSDTAQTFTIGSDVAIGEIVTYEATLTLSPGTVDNLTLTDVLEQGLAFVACDSITTTGSITASAGAWSDICNAAVVSAEPPSDTTPVNQGRRVTWSFGTVINSGTDDATITVRYTVVVLDSADNVRGQTLRNAVTWIWNADSDDAQADPVTVVEPDLIITKEADPQVAAPGESITFTLTVTHSGTSNADAFDVELTDDLPVGLVLVSGTLREVSGLTPTSLTYDNVTRTITAVWDAFPQGATAVIEFEAELTVPDGVVVVNEALLAWSSLPGDLGADYALSGHNALARERNYDPPASGYVSRDSTEVYWELPDTGFAPGRVTPLPAMPQGFAYQDLGDLWLEIPRLGVKLPIIGVPRTAQGWDLTWLGRDSAGYLEGTTFPTWEGNAVITAHVFQADGLPGPFYGLDRLQWGDRILVHFQGQVYVYEVREAFRTDPYSTKAMQVPMEGYSWVTLFTCQGYDDDLGGYRWRVVVQAVLVQVYEE